MTHVTAHVDLPPTRRPDLATVSRGGRFVAIAVALATAGVLVLASILDPSPEGLGTHRQLSMPPCGWITLMDTPCPTCGMTTAFAHAANGNLLQSVLAQPFGALLALATAMAFLVATYVVITGSRIGVVFQRLWTRSSIWVVTGLAFAAWGFKIMSHKGLLP